MSEPAVALVFSPEPWVERLHRHLTDHGGARVRQIVLDPTLALEEHYDVLVVSHRWPGLTHRLVAALADRGRSVLGVFDPDEPAGRDHLLALGVSHVVAADAPVASFVGLLGELPRAREGDERPAARARDRATDLAAQQHATVVVTGASGAGVTEVALALAHACARNRATVLVDARERNAALAVRLGLAVEPALRDAVDAVEHATGSLSDTLTRVAPRFDVLPGMAAGALAPVAAHEVRNVVATLVDTGRAVVVDASSGEGTGRALIADAGVVVFVAGASPTGVSHTLAWASEHPALLPSRAHVVLNRASRERFRRGELERELVRTLGSGATVWFAPSDARVDDAAWDGGLVRRGPFVAAVERLATTVATPPRQHLRVPKRRRLRSAA
jgi:MinD-like ATPase involved in chromosome partitioning or flagellar assembly